MYSSYTRVMQDVVHPLLKFTQLLTCIDRAGFRPMWLLKYEYVMLQLHGCCEQTVTVPKPEQVSSAESHVQ